MLGRGHAGSPSIPLGMDGYGASSNWKVKGRIAAEPQLPEQKAPKQKIAEQMAGRGVRVLTPRNLPEGTAP
ncbi:hypothetical protein EI613_00010 [Azospirillum sp. 412522]|nr:hypothetical protein [Azospirillum sp. 412522]MBY6260313.1 hypothetical protein [Azospirillum sp. 412522]